jgi:predicted regulator of Ras-like GTPase activity (Roadblock/LC7/MglB family)
VKTNLFSRFRNLFRRAEQEYDYDEYYEEYPDIAIEEPVANEQSVDNVENGVSGGGPAGRSLRLPHGAQAPGAEPQEQGVHVSLAPIVAGMPLELQSRILDDLGDLSVFLPLDKILPQLSKGAVSVSFGELRKAAPQAFSGDRDQDAVEINVPLSAILPHISPDMLARKHGPLQMDIPEDIVSPFEGKGSGLAIAANQARPADSPSPQPRSAPVPAPQVSKPRPASPVTQPPLPTPTRPITMPRPVASPRPTPSLPRPVAGNGTSRLVATPQAPTVPPPAPAPARTAKGTQILPKPDLVAKPQAAKSVLPTVPTQTAASPVPGAPASSPEPAAGHPPLVVTLSAVADVWPDPLKQEILQLNLAEAKLAVPYDVVEGSLKRGRLSFPWAKVRSWIKPAPQIAASVHDPTELELPLRVIAPLFVARRKEQLDKPAKVAVDKDIPNLFFGLPQPDTTGVAVDHSVNKPVDTNYYIWDDDSDTVPDDASAHVPTAATEFVTRYATPNEVVSRAQALEGVEGALVALPDGLMVASQLPPGVNGDTLAAFLPQLFGKVTQCTQELRMGELNNLKFTVGNVPWKIFRVNALYFAAFGAKGGAMPTAMLAALAAELDHKAKV